jgi:CO/xanthine dehydrogenase FAD-binding subunit
MFVTHLTSSLEPDEVLVEVRLPLDGPGTGVGFQEVAARHGDYGFALVACSVAVEDGVVRAASLAAGAVLRPPGRPVRRRRLLVGGALDDERVAAAARRRGRRCSPATASTRPPPTRRHLVGVLAERAVRQAWADGTVRAAA